MGGSELAVTYGYRVNGASCKLHRTVGGVRGIDVPLQPDTERLLRQRRDELAEAEASGRAEAGLRFSEVIAGPRRAFLAAILEAVDVRGESQVDIAAAFGVSKGRVSQWVADARAESGG